MLKDITLGQYFPGNSPIHRLDPRTKLIGLVGYIVALFVAKSWISYGIMLVFLLVLIRVSAIPPKSIVKGMKPLVMILVFTGVLNLFFTGGETVLISPSGPVSKMVMLSGMDRLIKVEEDKRNEQ